MRVRASVDKPLTLITRAFLCLSLLSLICVRSHTLNGLLSRLNAHAKPAPPNKGLNKRLNKDQESDQEHTHEHAHEHASAQSEAGQDANPGRDERLVTLDREVISLITQREATRDSLRALTPRLQALRERLRDLERSSMTRRRALTRALTLRRRLKGARIAELLLSAEGPLELKRRELSLRSLFKGGVIALKALSAELKTLNATRAQLEQTSAEVSALNASLSEQVEGLLRLRAQEAQRSALNSETSQGRAHLAPPLLGVWRDSFQSYLGPHEARLYGHGVWIKGAPRAPVYAVEAGKVIFVGWVRGRGDVVILKHEALGGRLKGGSPVLSVYAGVTPSVKVGDHLSRQAQLGALNEASVEVGLSFELRRGSTPIYPRRWVREVPLITPSLNTQPTTQGE